MSASIGLVSLPYGVEIESPDYNATVNVTKIPLGAYVLEDMGLEATPMTLTTTVNKTTLESLLTQFEGIRMVSFDVGDENKGDTDPYGIYMTGISVNRQSKMTELYKLNITAYKLDFNVSTIKYTLFNDYSLPASTQATSDDTDETIDDYTVGLTLKTDKNVLFWIQYSDDKITWNDHPSDLAYDMELQKRNILLNKLTGYLRIVALNQDVSNTATISATMYLSKQIQ